MCVLPFAQEIKLHGFHKHKITKHVLWIGFVEASIFSMELN